MNLLQAYIDSLPIEVPMNFGINSNVKLLRIDIQDRLTRKGEVSPKTFFMEFVKINEDGEAYQREEFSFFKFNADKLDFAERNFNDQFNKLLALGEVLYGGDMEAMDRRAVEISDRLFGDGEDILALADEVFIFNSKTKSKNLVKPKPRELKAIVENLNEKLNEFFYELFEGKYGMENSPVMEIISIVDKKGYKNLPDESDFVSSVEGELSLDQKYLRRKEASEKPEQSDEVGEDISEEGVVGLDTITDDLSDDDDDDGAIIEEIGDIDGFESLDALD